MTGYPNIQAFLAELREKLEVDPAVLDRILAETEDHLGEAVEQLRSSGLTPEDAEWQALEKLGSASEIARSYFTESQQQQGRWRFALTRWRTLAAVAALVGLVFLGRAAWEYGTVGGSPAAESNVQKAFTTNSHIKFFDATGMERGSGAAVMVYRSDGSKAFSTSGYVAVPGSQPQRHRTRTVEDRVANVRADALLDYNLISSQRLPQKGDPEFHRWSIPAAKHCSILLSALEADPETERNSILGYDVLKHDYAQGPGHFKEVWVAPELDCYELRSTVWEAEPETFAKKHISSTTDVVSVAEGEPAADHFRLPEGLEEVPPSELWRVSLNLMGPLAPDIPKDAFAERDQVYNRLRRTAH
jgi:hypothetical protein